ncbi:LexA repressor [Syntrophomonas zehnderi OL-4]|uniref:LexA repressor n=1 Tax=Syntrophomonas zehnderi OL-4 TaxID=690567 RepID=A0A0E4GAD1_9FIRM|nr:transcriptional repressor LexA [Syntrophomonas zehnderi]CFX44831.1 LexA repressor [Syntrophomonas zehnderi OL-4]
MTRLDSLNERQRQILQFIQKKTKTQGYPPSVREIGAAVGLKSSSTVHMYLVQLEEKGYIKRDPSKPRAIIVVQDEPEETFENNVRHIPVLGKVAAGAPILAEENIDSYMAVPVDLLGNGNYYILRVKGDSMVDAGILDNDYVIVREQRDAANGEIVVALLEDEATVKRYYKMSDHYKLQPENSALQPIITRELTILGKVAGLLRRI